MNEKQNIQSWEYQYDIKHNNSFFSLPCQPMEYGKEDSNKLSYLISNLFMISARPDKKRNMASFGLRKKEVDVRFLVCIFTACS